MLEGVCGAAAPFQLTALLGPSGAGKSTLMDILCMRQQSNGGGGGGGGGAKMVVTGEVCVNGRPCSCSGKEVVARSAYIPQHDSFFPQLTAREVLQFYASILLQKQQQQQQVNSYGATAVPLPAATGDSDDNPRRGDGDQNPRGRIQPHQQQSQHGRSLKNFLCNLCGRSSSGSSDGDAEADGGGTGGGGELACSGCSSCARCCNCWPNHQADIAAPTADGRTPGQQIVSAAGFGTVSEASLRQQRIDEVLLALGTWSTCETSLTRSARTEECTSRLMMHERRDRMNGLGLLFR